MPLRAPISRFLAVLALSLPALPQTAPLVLARLSPDGKIRYEAVELFTVNGHDRVRALDEAKDEVNPALYGRLAKLPLARSGALVRLPDGALARLTGSGKRLPILPDELKMTGPAKIADLWKSVRLTARASRKDKADIGVPLSEFFALLSGPTPAAAAVAFVKDPGCCSGVVERLAALSGVVEAFPKEPETDTLRIFLEKEMQAGFDALEAGGPYRNFLDTVRTAETARAVFPGAAGVARLHDAILKARASIESDAALLSALLNHREWDDFLDKYPSIERYQASFPALVEGRIRALVESARVHVQRGRQLLEHKRHVEALRELRLALARDPDNQPVAKITEDTRIEASLAVARAKPRRPLQKGSPPEVRFGRHIEFALLNIADKKFDEAEKEIAAARELDPSSPAIQLSRARLLEGRNRLAEALALLDSYDESVVAPEERAQGEKVRIAVLYSLQKQKAECHASLQKAFEGARYPAAAALLPKCLQVDPADPDFLYYSGVLSAVLRKNEAAAADIGKYLALPASLRDDPKKRDIASRALAIVKTPRAPAALPPDAAYSPESLAFQPPVESIKGNRLDIDFEWTKEGRLASVVSRYQPPRTDAAGNFYFEYFPGSAQLFRVSDRKEKPEWREIVLPGNPVLNLDVVSLLGGPAAIGFSGNPYFNPFVWDGIHLFRFAYDKQGRVESAAEIGAKNFVRFAWEGERLQSVSAFASEAAGESAIYTRTLAYEQDRLAAETVTFRGRSYKIAYKYQGSRMTEASFDDNGAHDGHNRRVKFRP